MRKLFLTCVTMAVAFPVALLTGCTDQSGVKEQTTIRSPEGDTTKVTRETKVETTGDNPPLPAPKSNP